MRHSFWDDASVERIDPEYFPAGSVKGTSAAERTSPGMGWGPEESHHPDLRLLNRPQKTMVRTTSTIKV
jgi:hypothetical protein